MQRDRISYGQYATSSNDSICDFEPISPLRASVDPRFSSLLLRAANNRERASQQQVSPTTSWASPSSSVAIVSSNAWSPMEKPNEKLINTEKKSCLSAVWKNRLLGLLVGLAIAAISIGIILGVLLTRRSADSTTPTPTTTSACSSLQWNPIPVTVAGNGTYGSAANQLSYAWGIYIDSNNALYVADSDNHRIQKWLPNAVSGTTVAGVTGVWGSNGSLLYYPRTVYGDSQQNLYIADNNGISLWASGASVGTQIPGSASLAGSINALYVDKNGNLYASTTSDCTVRMWTPATMTSVTVAGGGGCGYSSSQLYYSYGFSVDSSTNTIYVANRDAQTIVAWPVGATTGTIILGLNSTSGGADFLLNYPYDVKLDQYGNLYVADSNNDRILLFCRNPSSTSGRIIAGYQLSYQVTIALDSDMNLYVSDSNNYRVQKYIRIV